MGQVARTARWDGTSAGDAGGGVDPLTARVDALGELLGLSRTRISPDALAETSELLQRVGERRRLSLDHTVVALAGATGSGKSTLFNTLAGRDLSETGVRRPTTARPVAYAWQPERAAGLLDRLGIAPGDRYAGPGVGAGAGVGLVPWPGAGPDAAGAVVGAGAGAGAGTGAGAGAGVVGRGGGADGLDGLVLIDLPDHDSAATGHREQVDRLLRLVDVVVWVLDPEKYADAALHERYLRPLAGHADVTVLVLNQIDRLPGDAVDLVLDDLRRLLDEDGIAVGEHGEAGAVVLAASALTGEGMADLRAVLAQITGERAAAGRRLAADVDRTASTLHPLYVGDGGCGLTDQAREEFVHRLADAVGAAGAGQSAERDWSRAAEAACGTPWSRLLAERTPAARGSRPSAPTAHPAPISPERRTGDPGPAGDGGRRGAGGAGRAGGGSGGPVASRPVVDEAVRGVVADAARGLPAPWAQAVRDAARRGGDGLPAALDRATARAVPGPPERPGWWSAAGAVQWLLMALALSGAVCLAAVARGALGLSWWPPLVMMAAGGIGGPLTAGICRIAARGPARRYGQEAERRLRAAAADCGRARVLEPLAAELMRYREVREQYAVVVGARHHSTHSTHSAQSLRSVHASG